MKHDDNEILITVTFKVELASLRWYHYYYICAPTKLTKTVKINEACLNPKLLSPVSRVSDSSEISSSRKVLRNHPPRQAGSPKMTTGKWQIVDTSCTHK
jgi:hypothetical protein